MQIREAPGGTTFHFNADMSGDVLMRRLSLTDSGVERRELEVPANDLLRFVAEFVRREKIAALERAPWWEVLGLSSHSVPENKR